MISPSQTIIDDPIQVTGGFEYDRVFVATNLNDNYPGSDNAQLDTVPIILPSGACLGFWMWYDCEPYYDGMNVKISTDGGTTWSILGSYKDPYNVHEAYSFNPVIPGESCFSGDNQGYWEYIKFDLSAYAGEMVKIRFHFGSDSVFNYPGFYIDDINIYKPANLGDLLPMEIFLYEDFEGSWPPTGWQIIDYGSLTPGWIQYTYGSNEFECAGTGTYYAGCWYTQGTGFDSGLFTPSFDSNGKKEILMKLEHSLNCMAVDKSGKIFLGYWISEGNLTVTRFLQRAKYLKGVIAEITSDNQLKTIYEGGIPQALAVSETGELYAAVWGKEGSFRPTSRKYSMCGPTKTFWIAMAELSIAHCWSAYHTPLPYIIAQLRYLVKSRKTTWAVPLRQHIGGATSRTSRCQAQK